MPTNPNPNQVIFDASVRHQINLIRYAEGIQNAALKPLKKNEAHLRSLILTWGGYQEDARLRRLPVLQTRLAAARTKAWGEAQKIYMGRMRELARVEPQIVAAIAQKVGLTLTAPPADVIRDIVTTQAVEGRTLRQWLRTVQGEDLRRLQASVAQSAVIGRGGPATAQASLGSPSLGGADGALAATRRSLQSIARTGASHVVSEVYSAVLAANPNAFDRELYTAILDTRTTALCRDLDGNIYPIGQGPRPPMHFNCRSRRVPLLKGFPDPARQSYAEWITTQPQDVQEDALGVAKARLFRAGKLTLGQFVAEDGRELTLAQLAARGITE